MRTPPQAQSSSTGPRDAISRRALVKQTLAVSAGIAAAAGGATGKAGAAEPPVTGPAGQLPKGKIGDLEVSRLILGSNHITFFMHSRDLRYVDALSRHYNTDDKIVETFAVAEANGVNTFMTHSDPKIEKLFREHRDRRGGKMQWIVAPWITPGGMAMDLAAYRRVVPELVAETGVDALYVPGMLTGPLLNEGKGAMIGEMLEVIHASGVPAGVACHGLDVVRFCEQQKLPVDFYVKTFHHLNYPTAPKAEEIEKVRQSGERYARGDLKSDYAEVPGYWCGNPEETAEFMKGVAKPWIAFKVMAAGAIRPRDGFNYAYANGADFILAGMFDFQLAEDAAIARELVPAHAKRARPWRG